VPAVEAATLLLLEPVLNPVWTWITQGEKLSAATMAGGALIISAIFGSTLYQARQRVVAVSP
jgi:drug/metabolite transporter (DMT)-like permease